MQSNLTLVNMLTALFGLTPTNTGSSVYFNAADYTLLPINPNEPGRFNVIRDFKMYVSPGYRQDYYKKIVLLQRDLYSSGRFYFGTSGNANNNPPGDMSSNILSMRNNIYIVLLYQSPTIYGANTAGSPDFTISLQSRLAFYDN